MHTKINEIYHFIHEFKEADLINLNNRISLIYRNYKKKINIDLLKKLKKFCRKHKKKLYLANEIKVAHNLGLDGAYIPAFNKNFNHKRFSKKNNFKIIGSAHNVREINIKEKQGVESIFLSPIFKTKNKKSLGIYRFLLLKKLTNRKVIALGGIDNLNIRKVKLINCYGIASISFIKSILK